MKYLFLYTELADYTISCLKCFKLKYPADSITVIHYPVNPEAPFKFDFKGIGSFHDVSEFKDFENIDHFVRALSPDKIICSGWINKWYLRICFEHRRSAVCVLTLDNHWHATPKQIFMSIVGRLILTRIFKKVWVPGSPQFLYARKMGFRETDIATGFYSCDTDNFLALGNSWLPNKEKDFPRRILCVARYIPAKGYAELWRAFIEWQQEDPSEWELWCVGHGEGFKDRVQHPRIKHLGFLQKHQWDEVIRNTGIFILPSHFEPWGVVVHEFAAAGYPLILSDKVGAGEFFLSDENGWTFRSGDIEALKIIFRKLKDISNCELLRKAKLSKEYATKHSTEHWAETLALL